MSTLPKNLFKKYAGMRVVLTGGKVVAAAKDAVTALNEAKKRHSKKKLSIFAVPVKGYKSMVI